MGYRVGWLAAFCSFAFKRERLFVFRGGGRRGMGVLNSFDSIYRFFYETLSDIKAVFCCCCCCFGRDGEGGGKEEGWWW